MIDNGPNKGSGIKPDDKKMIDETNVEIKKRRLLNISEASREFGLSRHTVRAMIRAGQLGTVSTGKGARIDAASYYEHVEDEISRTRNFKPKIKVKQDAEASANAVLAACRQRGVVQLEPMLFILIGLSMLLLLVQIWQRF